MLHLRPQVSKKGLIEIFETTIIEKCNIEVFIAIVNSVYLRIELAKTREYEEIERIQVPP